MIYQNNRLKYLRNYTFIQQFVMAEKDKAKDKVDLGLLEEDDEFEEFPAEGLI